jgi:hypothetical protein
MSRLVLSSQSNVGFDHHHRKLIKNSPWHPTKFFTGFRWIAQQQIDTRRTEIPRIDFEMITPAETKVSKRGFEELLNGVGPTGGHHEIIRHVSLQHPPHGIDTVTSEPQSRFD